MLRQQRRRIFSLPFCSTVDYAIFVVVVKSRELYLFKWSDNDALHMGSSCYAQPQPSLLERLTSLFRQPLFSLKSPLFIFVWQKVTDNKSPFNFVRGVSRKFHFYWNPFSWYLWIVSVIQRSLLNILLRRMFTGWWSKSLFYSVIGISILTHALIKSKTITHFLMRVWISFRSTSSPAIPLFSIFVCLSLVQFYYPKLLSSFAW